MWDFSQGFAREGLAPLLASPADGGGKWVPSCADVLSLASGLLTLSSVFTSQLFPEQSFMGSKPMATANNVQGNWS